MRRKTRMRAFSKLTRRVADRQRSAAARPATGADNRKRDFYVRQLWDQKGSALIETMGLTDLSLYAGTCAAILARERARSGDRIAIAGYLGSGNSIDRAIG